MGKRRDYPSRDYVDELVASFNSKRENLLATHHLLDDVGLGPSIVVTKNGQGFNLLGDDIYLATLMAWLMAEGKTTKRSWDDILAADSSSS